MRRLVELGRATVRDARAHAATIAYGAEGWHCNKCCTGANGMTLRAAQAQAGQHNANKHGGSQRLVRNDG